MTATERDQRLRAARAQFLTGEHTQALHALDTLERELPNDLAVLLAYGAAQFATFEHFEEAASLFERALKVAPDSLSAQLWLADVSSYGYGRDYEGAATLYREVMAQATAPDDLADAAVGLYLSTRAPGKPVSIEDAAIALRRAHDAAPERGDVALALGYALIALGQTEAAAVELGHSVEIYQRQGGKQQGIAQRALDQVMRTDTLTSTSIAIASPRQQRWLDPATLTQEAAS